MKRTFLLLLAFAALFLSCASNARGVRTAYAKQLIAFPAVKENYDLFKDSDYKSFIFFKTSQRTEYDMRYFVSYCDYSTYSSQYSYTKYDITINSSTISPGSNFEYYLSIFPDAYQEKGGVATMMFYQLEGDRVLSKAMTIKLAAGTSVLAASGKTRGDMKNAGVRLDVVDRGGNVLYSSGGDGASWVLLEPNGAKDGIQSFKISGLLKSAKGGDYLAIDEGEVWIKI